MYLTRAELANDYKISLPTVDRYLKDMRSKPKFRNAVLRMSSKCTRVNATAFRDYLLERSKR